MDFPDAGEVEEGADDDIDRLRAGECADPVLRRLRQMVEAGQLDPVVDVHPRAGPARRQPAPGRQPLRVNAVLRGAEQHRVVRQRAPGGGDSPGAGAFPAAGRAAQQHAAAVERQERSVQDQQLPPQQQREEAVPDDALQCVELPQQRLIPGFVQEYLPPGPPQSSGPRAGVSGESSGTGRFRIPPVP